MAYHTDALVFDIQDGSDHVPHKVPVQHALSQYFLFILGLQLSFSTYPHDIEYMLAANGLYPKTRFCERLPSDKITSEPIVIMTAWSVETT